MSNEHQIPDNGGFEREDLSAKAVFGFLIVLAVLGVVVYFVVNVTYHGLNSYFASHQPAESPMRPAGTGDTRDLRAAEVKAKIENTFPQPLLETDERNELNDFRTHRKRINSIAMAGWIKRRERCASPSNGRCSCWPNAGCLSIRVGQIPGRRREQRWLRPAKRRLPGNAAKQ